MVHSLNKKIFPKSYSDSIISRKIKEKIGKLTLFKRVCHSQNGCKKTLMI